MLSHRHASLTAATAAVVLVISGASLGVSASASVAEPTRQVARAGEYEPNDYTAQATSLGAPGTSYTAAIETKTDIDMFEFYVAVHGSQVFFPITNTTPGVRFPNYETISAEIRNAEGDVLTSTDPISAGASQTASYSLPAGRYYLVIESQYTDDNLIRPYTFTLNGTTVDAATMQSICTEAKADAAAATKRVNKKKRALRRADTPRETRKARAKLKKAKKALRVAQRRSVTYCVVLE